MEKPGADYCSLLIRAYYTAIGAPIWAFLLIKFMFALILTPLEYS
jgi:hypothetical protein